MGGFIRHKGENISSYQIEDIVNSHPDVNSSAAFPIPAGEGLEDDIVVYIVIQPGKELNEVQLREWLKGKMPKFMWPQHIRFIDELPRTPTNKLEKYKLKNVILEELARKA
jgi:crotonobetaine/carnitine-CoA ligase